MEVKFSDYIVRVNNVEVASEWYGAISRISVELNEQKLDNCTIDIGLNSIIEESMLCTEGDDVDIYVYEQGNLSGRENIFSGIVKTITPDFKDSSNIKIELFENLFLLDFSDEAVESASGKGTMGLNFKDIIDMSKNVAESILPDWLSGFLGIESPPSGSMVSSFLKELQKKYPSIIKKIVVKDVDIAFDEKTMFASGETDYQKIIRLARTFNRTVFLKKGILYFIHKYELLKNPFIFNPSLIQSNVSNSNYFLSKVNGRTTLKSLTENMRVYATSNKCEGTSVADVSGEEAKEKPHKIEINLDNLTKEKDFRYKQYQNSIGTDKEEIARGQYQEFKKYYDEVKSKEELFFKSLSDDFVNKRRYSYDVLKSLNNGIPFRTMAEHKATSDKDLRSIGKNSILNSDSNFVELNVSLMYGNNIIRPFQVATVILLNNKGVCVGYYKRFSGEYNISKVSFDIGDGGFNASISFYRNYLIEQ